MLNPNIDNKVVTANPRVLFKNNSDICLSHITNIAHVTKEKKHKIKATIPTTNNLFNKIVIKMFISTS